MTTPLRQTSLPTLGGSAPDRGESALSGSLDMGRLVEMLGHMMDTRLPNMENCMERKMDANAQRMEVNAQALRGDMQTQRGEMQSMGLSLQSGQKAIRAIARGEMRTMDCIMAAPRGGDTEPAGSANGVGPAMDTGKVGVTRDAVTVIGETETCRVRHEEMTEKLNEETETQELKEIKETKGETNEREG